MQRSRRTPGRLVAAAVLTASLAGAATIRHPARPLTAASSAGSGAASSRVTRLALRSSGAAVAFGLGVARARYQGAQGNAQAVGADLGLFTLAATAPFMCGQSPGKYFPDGVPPRPITVSSGDGPVTERSASFGEGTPAAVVSQEASAAPHSQAAARVIGVSFTLPGLVELQGGLATSGARLTPGAQRDAEARSDIGSLVLAGGLVRLDGLTWTAGHHTGTAAEQAGAFRAATVCRGRDRAPHGRRHAADRRPDRRQPGPPAARAGAAPAGRGGDRR